MQLATIHESNLNMYFKKGEVGDDPNAEERLEEREDEGEAIKEFSRLFEEITGNEFEPWEQKRFRRSLTSFSQLIWYNRCTLYLSLLFCHLMFWVIV